MMVVIQYLIKDKRIKNRINLRWMMMVVIQYLIKDKRIQNRINLR